MKIFYNALIDRMGSETAASFERRAKLRPGALQNLRRGATPSRPTLLKIASTFGDPVERWFEIAKETRNPAILPGRSRRNRCYLDI